ncbi:homoserine O-acetyltransferase [Streptomyces luteoverticillatus]|uniref:Homoserine O-acetyltransferase n=1 Tax=Streptomyces luteoverticillatus TaxID=66425 RepID=A0A3S9PTY5_STRLT|nr:homoserine O-acetyltransferase [Streptomyces luteoverticillatus]AZQ75826.1 homoserine O-acetyltransferase [Streptomyces luteoverticillatus]
MDFPPPDGRPCRVDVGPLTLESGEVLPEVRLAVQCWGRPSAARDNVVLVLHALTGDAHAAGPAGPGQPTPGWWDGLIGPGRAVDTGRWCVLAANVLGGCRGSTGPAAPHPDGGVWGGRFPEVSVRDQVAAEAALADVLGIGRFAAVAGGSMGGARALEWTIGHPHRVAAALVLAVGARATADQIGTQSTQIEAITGDPHWQEGNYHGTGRAPTAGLALARRIAHLTYRTELELDERFANAPQRPGRELSAVESYLRHQARKLVDRFDPSSYVVLTRALNGHDVGRGRGGVDAALAGCPVPTVVAGIASDRLYPLRLQRELAEKLPGCRELTVIDSRQGHDGFLTETGAVGALLAATLRLADG